MSSGGIGMAGKGNASLQPAEHHRKTSSTPEGASVPLFGRGREFFVLGDRGLVG